MDYIKTYGYNVLSGILSVVVIGLIAYTYMLKMTIAKQETTIATDEAKINECATVVTVQNAAVKANEQDQDKVAELPKVVTKIQTRYVYVHDKIEEFNNDKNISNNDCSTSMEYIDNFDYSL